MVAPNVQMMIESLKPWFHNIHLPDGSQTAPDHALGDFPNFKWQAVEPHLPRNMEGWSVLDIGCNAGFYSIKFAQKGARVFAFDHDPHYLAQARWALNQFNLSHYVELRQMQIYDLAQVRQQFDLVCFMGVFYHLRYPLLALDIAAQKTAQLMIFQSLMMPGEDVINDTTDRPLHDRNAFLHPAWPKMAFIEHSFSGDPTNWWVPNRGAVEAMLRSTGMNIIARPDTEIYFCERALPPEDNFDSDAAQAASQLP